MSDQKHKETAFEEAADSHQSNFFSELFAFLRENKKWWLAPIIVMLLLFGVLIILGGSAAAPFVYTFF